MKKEINPAVAIGMIVVILIGIVIFYWQAQDSRTLPSIPRGSVHHPSAGGNTAGTAQKRAPAGG